MARKHSLLQQAILYGAGIAILTLPSLAQPAFTGPLPAKGTGLLANALNRFVDFFKNDYTILFIIYIGGWALIYTIYRIGLERSGQIPTVYCSRLASILALLTIVPGLYALQRYPNVKAAVRGLMGGWYGIIVTLIIAFLIYGIAYIHIRGWFGNITGGGGAPGGGTP